MALNQGGECFAKWTHVEDGQVLSRRLHRIVIQTADGDLKTITGDRLPDSIQTCSGLTYVGTSLAQTLLLPKSSSPRFEKRAPRLPAKDGWWLPQEVRDHLAALRQTIECSARLDNVENGPPLHRQVRRIEVQTRGRLYVFSGKRLPAFIGICTGEGFKGRHTAQILLSADSGSDGLGELLSCPSAHKAWPELRDVVHAALGIVGFLVFRFLLNVVTSLS